MCEKCRKECELRALQKNLKWQLAEKNEMSVPGYESLAGVLRAAFEQASEGKGKERHATDKGFEEQSMQVISDLLDSPDGMAYQVIKKVRESSRLSHDARRRELLGAIIYAAGIVLYHDRAAVQGGAHD